MIKKTFLLTALATITLLLISPYKSVAYDKDSHIDNRNYKNFKGRSNQDLLQWQLREHSDLEDVHKGFERPFRRTDKIGRDNMDMLEWQMKEHEELENMLKYMNKKSIFHRKRDVGDEMDEIRQWTLEEFLMIQNEYGRDLDEDSGKRIKLHDHRKDKSRLYRDDQR